MSNVLEHTLQINKFNLYRCENCGLLITKLIHNNFTQIFNKSYYSNQYIKNYYKKSDKLYDRFLLRVREIEKIKQGGRILDLGCGLGLFLNVIKNDSKYKWLCYGVDINKQLISEATKKIKNVEFIHGTLLSSRFANNYFDCITCFDVLEHDFNIVNTLKELIRILKHGGLLIIQCPNYTSIMAKLTGKNWDWWSVPDHIIHFSPTTIVRILEDCGFTIQSIYTWEPAKDFVDNICGTLKKKLPAIMSINRIICKLSMPFLYILWLIIFGLEKMIPIGGLSLVYVNKK